MYVIVQCSNFKTLKISFFGGEPFLNFEGIRKILDFARTFCKTRDVVLLADFTTNATLIRKEHLEYLQDLKCCLYPCCLGPCNKNILKSPDRTCIIDEMNLSMRDYLMYNFKLNLLYENFSDTNL